MHMERSTLVRETAGCCLEEVRRAQEAGRQGWWQLGPWSEVPYCREPADTVLTCV